MKNREGFVKAYLPLALVLVAVLIVMLQFGFIFLILALLPSIVAFFIDRDKRHSAFKIVFACNLAATLPTIMPMLRSGLEVAHNDFASLQSPSNWLFVYSGAAAGWCIIFLCRYIARFVVILTYEYNIMALEKTQKHLIEEWGQSIKQPPRIATPH